MRELTVVELRNSNKINDNDSNNFQLTVEHCLHIIIIIIVIIIIIKYYCCYCC